MYSDDNDNVKINSSDTLSHLRLFTKGEYKYRTTNKIRHLFPELNLATKGLNYYSCIYLM